MSLDDYKRKRRFATTPEPHGDEEGDGEAEELLTFVVQKHRATRLHYDLRLQIGDTFKSWAVPKGFSLAPGDQRLAVKVEDHPLAYGDFEGIIPKGNYGAGTVMIWDRGSLVERGSIGRKDSNERLARALEDGHITFILHGSKLAGEFALIRLKGAEANAWLLVKKRDEFSTFEPIADDDRSVATGRSMAEIQANAESKGEVWLPKRARAEQRAKEYPEPDAPVVTSIEGAPDERLPRTPKPMLAVKAAAPIGVLGWRYEKVFGGKRALAVIDKGTVELLSKQGLSFKAAFPGVVSALKSWKRRAVLDGEIVAAKGGAVFYVNDLLHLDGKNARALPLKARKELLAALDVFSEEVQFVGDDDEAPEGEPSFLARHQNSLYEAGTSRFWIKSEQTGQAGDAAAPRVTHADKVYWPKEGYTKGDLVAYYRDVAPYILPYLKSRPESLHRHPDGIEQASFFQKDMTGHVPSWIKTVRIESQSAGRTISYLVCDDEATLLYMANLGCIEINPWLAPVSRPDHPDWSVIDLDPDGQTQADISRIALTVGEELVSIGAPGFVKTSGADGMHIYVPLDGTVDFDDSRAFAEAVCLKVHARHPDSTSMERNPARRRGRLYLDYMQNRRGQTIAAPYCVRPVPLARVSTPLTWEELAAGVDPREFTIKTIPERLKRVGDVWSKIHAARLDFGAAMAALRR